MKITRQIVEYLCEASRIEFEEEEYDNIVKDLQNVVDSFNILDEIEDIDLIKNNNVKLNAETDLREDTPKQGLSMDKIIDNAPESCGGAIVVPAMVE